MIAKFFSCSHFPDDKGTESVLEAAALKVFVKVAAISPMTRGLKVADTAEVPRLRLHGCSHFPDDKGTER